MLQKLCLVFFFFVFLLQQLACNFLFLQIRLLTKCIVSLRLILIKFFGSLSLLHSHINFHHIFQVETSLSDQIFCVKTIFTFFFSFLELKLLFFGPIRCVSLAFQNQIDQIWSGLIDHLCFLIFLESSIFDMILAVLVKCVIVGQVLLKYIHFIINQLHLVSGKYPYRVLLFCILYVNA